MRWWLVGLLAFGVLASAGLAFGQSCVPNELLVKFQPGTPAAVRAAAPAAVPDASARRQDCSVAP